MKKFLKFKNNQKRPILSSLKGFTLIETLTALLIFSTSVVVLISVTSQGFSNTAFAKNKLIASFLAQEGIEIVRNTRDSFGWDNTSITGVVSTLSCSKCVIAGSNSIFDRVITVDPLNISTVNQFKITSTVKWNQGLTQPEVEYIEYLFDWQ